MPTIDIKVVTEEKNVSVTIDGKAYSSDFSDITVNKYLGYDNKMEVSVRLSAYKKLPNELTQEVTVYASNQDRKVEQDIINMFMGRIK